MKKALSLNTEDIVRFLAVLTILGGAVFVLLKVENMLLTFVVAFIINYLAAPLVNYVERKGISRGIAVLLLYALICGGLGACVYLLLPKAMSELSNLQSEIPKYIQGIGNLTSALQEKLSAYLGSVHPVMIGHGTENTLGNVSKSFFEALPNYLSTFLTVILLAPFFAFFMLMDGREMTKKLLALVPNRLFELALSLHYQINRQIGGFIRARLLEAAIVGAVVGIGLMAIGFPFAGLLACVAGITNLIPYLGPVIGAVPGVMVALVQGGSGDGVSVLLVVLVYVLAQLIDMLFIIPLVVAKIVNLHAVTVVIVITIGAQVMGILGMIISIPIFSIVKLTATTTYAHLVEYRR